MKNVAVLMTCHNRRDKTLACLESFVKASKPDVYEFAIYLTDDGSNDGTSEAVRQFFPGVKIIAGSGQLFWAGGMRLAWQKAINEGNFDYYLLLNDDVELFEHVIQTLLETSKSVYITTGTEAGIVSGATEDRSGNVTYGGSIIVKNHLNMKAKQLSPNGYPQLCDFTNSNVLLVANWVVEKIGILDTEFTHGIADYDYSLRAKKAGIRSYLATKICGYCEFDHGPNWKTASFPLKERIKYLYSPKGLAFKQYRIYIKRHFPLYWPYAFCLLWLKTFFPSIWDTFKK